MPDRAPKLWLVDDDEELLELVSHRLQTQTPTDTSVSLSILINSMGLFDVSFRDSKRGLPLSRLLLLRKS